MLLYLSEWDNGVRSSTVLFTLDVRCRCLKNYCLLFVSFFQHFPQALQSLAHLVLHCFDGDAKFLGNFPIAERLEAAELKNCSTSCREAFDGLRNGFSEFAVKQLLLTSFRVGRSLQRSFGCKLEQVSTAQIHQCFADCHSL